MSVIPASGRLRQEDHQFDTSLGYIVNPVSKKERKENPSDCIFKYLQIYKKKLKSLSNI
jgi:hypothetical protein